MERPNNELVAELERQSQRYRVADALPYQYIGQVGKIDLVHLLSDQSFGIGFYLGVPAVESSPGGEAHVARVLDQIIRKLPAGYVAQWYRRNSTDVTDYLDLYRQQTGNDDIAVAVCEAAVQRWEQAIPNGFFPGDPLNFYPCREEMAVMIKSPPTNAFNFSAEQAFALLSNLEAPSPRYTRFAKQFENVVREVREAAMAGGLAITPMGGEAFVPFVVSLLYPYGKPRKHIPAHSGVDTVAEAISAAGHIDLLDEDGKVRTEGFRTVRDGKTSCHRVISMVWQPKAVKPGLCDEIMNKEPNLTFVTTVEMLPQFMEAMKIKAQQFLQSRTVTAFNATEAAEKNKSYTSVTKRLFAGEKICMVRMQAIISSDTEEKVENAAVRIQSAMEQKFTSITEEAFGTSLFLPGCLPFTHSARREMSLQRSRRMLSMDIAEMMPAGGRWPGVVPTAEYLSVESNRRKPIVMYANSIGGPLFINPHLCEENPHMLVAGGSGSGKSFFIHDLLLQMWRIPDLRAYLISIKADYKRLSHVLGKYIEIDLDKPISLNPFGGKPTNANQARWTAALVLMITEGEKEERVSREERILLEDCAMKASLKNWDEVENRPKRETLLEHIVSELQTNNGEMGRSLANKLKPYYAGPYRYLINAPRSLSKDDKFVFFNLANVKELSCCSVLMFCLFRFIDEIMYDPIMVGIPKALILDEGWAGMDDPASAGLFTKSFRAYRSLGGQAVAISQRFGDFDTPLGQAILANTATKIILPQAESELADLRKYIRLNDLEFEAVRNLRLHKRLYGEFFVKMQGLYSTTGRVVPDALKYAIATTDADDEAIHNRLLEEAHGDYLEAIANFANKYPFGNAVAH